MTVDLPRSDIIGMPMIGYGTWQIPQNIAAQSVAQAIQTGYTHIDCAHLYNNEQEIGKFFGSYTNRKDLFITSKLWGTDHEPHRVKPAFDLTLSNLQLEYLDLYLIHNPVRRNEHQQPLYYKKEWLLETWREMVKLKETGRVKYVGVSNFTSIKLGWLMEEDEAPSNNQVELHPYLPQNKLINFCKNNKIEISGYSPLGSPGTKSSSIDTTQPHVPKLFEDPVILKISEIHKVTPAQVLLKWGIQRGYPVIAKSINQKRMEENILSLNLKLSESDMESINSIHTKFRYFSAKTSYAPGQNAEDYWDGEYYN